MQQGKAHILSDLKKQILPLQGLKPLLQDALPEIGLGSLNFAFPHATFPLGSLHEFICEGEESSAASLGFVSCITGILMRKSDPVVWISSRKNIFPSSLVSFGMRPEKIIFIHLQKEKDILWAIEESLKCEGLAAVIGETRQLSFDASRRMQLAIEKSRVTGFLILHSLHAQITSSVGKWRIKSLPSETEDGLPGVGFPRWNVELLKIRNGKPGCWQLEWREGKFKELLTIQIPQEEQQKKAG
ncbi:MAG: ImuA family protein [Flavisolibacter sp.]